MFFINLGTSTKWMFILLSLAQRILLLIFQCHTVTHSTDLRRSPLRVRRYCCFTNKTIQWRSVSCLMDPKCNQQIVTILNSQSPLSADDVMKAKCAVGTHAEDHR